MTSTGTTTTTLSGSTSTSPASRPMATGGMLFAATIMVLSGMFQFFLGISAVAKDKIFIGTPNYVFKFDTTAWGWIHLVLGLIVAITGFFVFTAASWARFTAIGLVMLQAIGTFMFVPYFPFWTLTILALDIFIIWALAVGPTTGEQLDEDDYLMLDDGTVLDSSTPVR
jgi:hypothetical protein